MKAKWIVRDLLLIAVAAVLGSVSLYTFVNPAGFAPTGVEGLSLMAQKLFHINMGYVSLMINVPLLILAWFFINKKYVVYTLVYTVLSSGALILMEQFQMYEFVSAGGNTWVAVFASGIISGARTALMIKLGGSSGGVDIVASVIQKKRPYINIETLISGTSYVVIGISFFVYGNLESVIMSVVQMMIFNLAMNSLLKPSRNAVEVRIITSDPTHFREDILTDLKHGATVMDCRGMYTGDEKTMIVTIINIRQMSDLIKLSRKYPGSFIYFSDVSGVWGNFRWNKWDKVM